MSYSNNLLDFYFNIMSMLAGPRRKQKVINLRAKNNAWSNDSTKFGQRMLEKMGWSAGKGLGANENGIVEHVVAKYKNDDKGLGYEDKNDQWTKHEDDFNALLSSLSNGDDDNDKLHSGVSLEKKSKKSKARVHYHKFTRAKDLSRYSEKDLANIFGKKSLRNEMEEKEIVKEDVKTTEQVFTEKGSMEDYFKNKLLTLKSVNLSKTNNKSNESSEDETNHGFQGFSNNKNPSVEPFSFYLNNRTLTNINNTKVITEDNETIPLKTKQVRKSKYIDLETTYQNCDAQAKHTIENRSKLVIADQELQTKKSKKKKKSKETDETELHHNNILNNKKKDKKVSSMDTDSHITNIHKTKKKKKIA